MNDKDRNDTFLVIRLPMSLKKHLVAKAKKTGIKLSALVRELLSK